MKQSTHTAGTSFYSLPRMNGKDTVMKIQIKRELMKELKQRNRCFGTNSCDCSRCK